MCLSTPLTASHLSLLDQAGHWLKKANDQALTPEHLVVLSSLATWAAAVDDNLPTPPVSDLKDFIKLHSHWPRINKVKEVLERKLYQEKQFTQVSLKWFSDHSPVSLYGAAVLRHIQNPSAYKLAKKTFHSIVGSLEQQRVFLKESGKFLNAEDYQHRLELLFAHGESEYLQHLASFLPEGLKAEYAKLIKITKGHDLSSLNVSSYKDNPLFCFVIAQKYRMMGAKESNSTTDQKAFQWMETVGFKAFERVFSESCWSERNILSRRYIEQKDYKTAYKIISQHQLKSGENFAHAQWMKGWLLTAHLKKSSQAFEIFTSMHENVISSMSKSRMAYWAGWSAKQSGFVNESKEWFEKAAQHVATFYGQQARKVLGKGDEPLKISSPASLKKSVQSLQKYDLFQVIQLLIAANKESLAEGFVFSLKNCLKTSLEQNAFLVWAIHQKQPSWAVEVSKKVASWPLPLIKEAYPLLPINYDHCPKPLTLAIIRQESRFRHSAQSPAGAKGLMQLMPATAEKTAKRHHLQFTSLFHVEDNIKIGTKHLSELLEKFQGSVVLTICAYNAGAAAVEKWIEVYGDPRSSNVNLIEWIEHIPFAETRNYVQRVLENMFVYESLHGEKTKD